MSSIPNWGLIGSGEVFQSLINTLVAHKDPRARVLTRPGRDGAQDCVSSDGATVYQAKFHADRSAAKVLRDAREEAGKIAGYRLPGDSRFHLWQGKSRWVAVTNAPFNANDRSKWDAEIAPLFLKLGLTAECWTSGDLESLLTDYPEVYRAYFEGETRLFLSLPEIQRVLVESELVNGESGDGFSAPFVGRERAFEEFEQFLIGEQRVLLVHGPGGIGKSRFLFEAACRAIDAGTTAEAYWGNLANLEASTAWYAGLVPERDALVVLDEPEHPELLRRILEELRGSLRTANWKVVVAVRTPNDPVVNVLRDRRHHQLAQEIELRALSRPESVHLAQRLADRFLPNLLNEDRARLIEALSAASGAFPMWMSVATELLRSGQSLGALPQDQFQLADRYLDEIITRGLAGEERRATLDRLRWVSLCQPVNSEDERLFDFLSTRNALSAASFLQSLVQLSSRRVLIRSGLRKRIFSVSPDVLRDHILLTWLSFVDDALSPPKRRPTEDAEAVARVLLDGIRASATSPYLERLIGRVGYVEFLLNGEVDILTPVALALTEVAAADSSAVSRRILLSRSTVLARFRPGIFTQFVRFLREHPASVQTNADPPDTTGVTQDDLVLEMAWPLFRAGASSSDSASRVATLEELVAVAHAEHALLEGGRILPNDGRRAGALLRRLITNDAELVASYRTEAYEFGRRLIATMSEQRRLSGAELAVIKDVVEPQVELERTQSWADKSGIYMARVEIGADSEEGRLRGLLLEQLWALVESTRGEPRSRALAWKIIARAQRDANQGARRGDQALATESTRALERTLGVVSRTGASLAEVQAARRVWDWNARFDEEAHRHEVATECERVLTAHPEAAGVAELLLGDGSERDSARDRTVAELSVADIDALGSFFDRCILFVSGSSEQWRLGLVRGIAFDVGKQGVSNAAVAAYACASAGGDAALFEIRLGMLSGLSEALRPSSDAALVVRRALAAAESDRVRAQIVFDLYGLGAPVLSARLTLAELDVALDHFELQFVANPAVAFRVLGRFVGVDTGRVFSCAKSAWTPLSPMLRDDCFTGFVNGIHDRLLFRDTHAVTFGTFEWSQLLEFMVGVPDIDGLGANLFWTLNDMRHDAERLTPQWMVSFLNRRDAELRHLAGIGTYVVPHQGDMFQWLRDVDPTSPADRCALEEVISWLGREDEVGFAAPSVLSRLDASGQLVPSLIASRLESVDSAGPIESIWQVARVGSHYVEGSTAWRAIALAACRVAQSRAVHEDREIIYEALKWHGPEGWSGRHGEFHPRWEEAVREAKAKLDAETDEGIRGYFDWRLRMAEERLEHERGLFEEGKD